MLNNNLNINKNKDDNTGLVYYMIKKYSRKKDYTPVKNVAIDIETKERIYKLIRLNDEQFDLLGKNSIPISDDYGHLMYLSMDKDIIYSSFSKMYVALKKLFGEGGNCYDDWKGSFSFPFLIYFQKKEEFGYLMNLYNLRSSIEFKMAKLIYADNESFKRDVLHNPFEEFPKEEINYFINYFVGFLTGYFESIKDQYDEFFFNAVRSNLILFGYKDGCFFDNQYKNEEEFNEALHELMKNE
jgi:hypothetical protein